jgi:hypothetical protein
VATEAAGWEVVGKAAAGEAAARAEAAAEAEERAAGVGEGTMRGN